jgi:hypothetical protein
LVWYFTDRFYESQFEIEKEVMHIPFILTTQLLEDKMKIQNPLTVSQITLTTIKEENQNPVLPEPDQKIGQRENDIGQ